MIEIGNTDLAFDDFLRVVREESPIKIAETARDRIQHSAAYVRRMAESGNPVYGVTTGFGANRDQVIAKEDAETLQVRLILSHACGVGDQLPKRVVRGMMLLRINALARGFSGITIRTLQCLIDMLNAGVHPVVPELGSVGASGDLCPLAHMCLPIIGRGRAEFQGEVYSGPEALQKANIPMVTLTYKEGLALLNGTQAQTAVGMVAAHNFEALLDVADLIGAMSLEAVAGRTDAFDPRIHEVRGRSGQIRSAANVRQALIESELANIGPGVIEGKEEYVQDSYCLRCLPQVHGACRDVLFHVKQVLETEMNAVTDNPLVFSEGDNPGILSGGNFHGEPIAMAMDYLKTAVAELGNISERRCAKLTDKCFSEGLPAFLVNRPGLNSGMMIPQYVAAALVTENKTHAFPSSVDSIPTSANMEDHVSMGMHSAVHCQRTITNTSTILAIEWLIASQALDLRDLACANGTGRAKEFLRKRVPFLEEDDRELHLDISTAVELLKTQTFTDLARDVFKAN